MEGFRCSVRCRKRVSSISRFFSAVRMTSRQQAAVRARSKEENFQPEQPTMDMEMREPRPAKPVMVDLDAGSEGLAMDMKMREPRETSKANDG